MSQPEPLPESAINEVLVAYALRFDGYKYAATRGGQESLARWSAKYVESLWMSRYPNKNHAIFFILQRFLYKWGGEMLSVESREQLAFRLLFLHLYQTTPPTKYAVDSITFDPRTKDPGHVERVAAQVRAQIIARTLQHGNPLRPGVGPRRDQQEPA